MNNYPKTEKYIKAAFGTALNRTGMICALIKP